MGQCVTQPAEFYFSVEAEQDLLHNDLAARAPSFGPR